MSILGVGIGFVIVGVALAVIGAVKLTNSTRVGPRDGMSNQGAAPKSRWGFVVLGILIMFIGYVLTLPR